MTDVQIEAGTLLANEDTRSVTGLLLPYGEVGNTNLGKFEVPPGSVKLPRDPSIVTANVDHDREQPVGRATDLTETPEGIVATFKIGDTEEGDELLASIADGSRSRLSVEVKKLVIRSGKAVSGTLFGAAFVAKGAFPSASLLAADVGDLENPDPNSPVTAIIEVSDDGTLDIETSTTPSVVNVHPADSDTPVEFIPKEGDDVPVATVPSTLTATSSEAPRTTLRDVTTALALYARSGDRSLLDNLAEKNSDSLYAALNDVKLTTSGSVGEAGGLQQPQWLGNIWDGRTFQRKVIPLIGHADLKSFKVTGFTWGTKPTMAAWSGDKANVPSNTPTTVPWTLTASRYAGGHDIAREFRDFDVPEFWEAYFKAMTDSYAKLTDDAALAALVAGATAVTAGAVPSGMNSATVSLIDGALAVMPNAIPSFAIAAPDVYRSLLLQTKDNIISTLNLSLGLEDGDLSGFKIIPHTGIATGKVLVGSKSAATEYELPGSPIRTEALDQIKGGIDEALFGYAATGINSASALALVTAAA